MMGMEEGERAQRVDIIINEGDRWQQRPLWTVILELLRREGASGATATRGIAGFAGHRPIHTVGISGLSADLPIVITWVDTPGRVQRLLPKLRETLQGGSLTVQEATWYRPADSREPMIARHLLVRDVMTGEVLTARSEMPVQQLAGLLAGRNFRGVPVVDDQQRVIGIVSTTDLAERATLPGGMGLRPGLTVADIMSTAVVTVLPHTALVEAARAMAERRLRRLPVVEDGRLVGIVSRYDLLRSASAGIEEEVLNPAQPDLSRSTPVSSIMRRNVPTVLEDDPLRAVVNTVGSSSMHLAVVLDEWRHVVGLISDAELVERLTPDDTAVNAEERRKASEEAPLLRARDVMQPHPATAFADTPLPQALRTMMEAGQKVLPVVDNAWRLEGVIDRSDLLNWYAQAPHAEVSA